eukprot:435622-Pleurochrysis_carterae.AAC.1
MWYNHDAPVYRIVWVLIDGCTEQILSKAAFARWYLAVSRAGMKSANTRYYWYHTCPASCACEHHHQWPVCPLRGRASSTIVDIDHHATSSSSPLNTANKPSRIIQLKRICEYSAYSLPKFTCHHSSEVSYGLCRSHQVSLAVKQEWNSCWPKPVPDSTRQHGMGAALASRLAHGHISTRNLTVLSAKNGVRSNEVPVCEQISRGLCTRTTSQRGYTCYSASSARQDFQISL